MTHKAAAVRGASSSDSDRRDQLFTPSALPGDATPCLLTGKHLYPVPPTRCHIVSAGIAIVGLESASRETYTAEKVSNPEMGKIFGDVLSFW